MIQPSQFKRWYDRQPKLSQAVQLISMMPDEIKSIVCEGLLVLANRELDESQRANSFRTLGSEKIMGVHKAKNKRRDYDRNEWLHKVMTYLYILSDTGQDQMAEHILEIIQYIQQYLQACQEFKIEPSLAEIGEITRQYIEQGGKKVRIFLRDLRKTFLLKSTASIETVPPETVLAKLIPLQPDSQTHMKDDRSGMKVKKLGIT